MSLCRRVGPLSLEVLGAEALPTPMRRWLDAELGDLPEGAGSQGQVLRIRFVDQFVLPRRDRVFPPVAYAEDGIAVVDAAGRAALLPLPDPTRGEIVVDRNINLFVFEEWVLLPALRLALEAAGGWLLRCAGAEIDGRRIAVIAPMRSGKTTVLIGLLKDGAKYLGDEWLALDASGSVHPVLAKVTLRDGHPDLGPRRRRIVGLRRSVSALVAAAARQSWTRWPALAVGFERLAETGWVLGFRGVPVGALSSVGLAGPGTLTDVVYLSPPSVPAPAAEHMATLVAALGDLDSRPNASIEAAFAALHPESAGRPLFRPRAQLVRAVASATDTATIHVVGVGEAGWEDRVRRAIWSDIP